jgi:hypothetical protein
LGTLQENLNMTNRTLADIALAKIYFELLVAFAKDQPGKTLTYGDLAAKAKAVHPADEFITGAIAVSMGRRLDTLREFTKKQQVPDLSALVVNRGTGNNGKGFSRSFDGEAVRKEIAQFDWGSVNVEFKTFIDLEVLAYEQRQVAKRKPKKINESEALTIWWDYYKGRKAEIGQISPDEKAKIIQAIMSGKEPPDALAGIKG